MDVFQDKMNASNLLLVKKILVKELVCSFIPGSTAGIMPNRVNFDRKSMPTDIRRKYSVYIYDLTTYLRKNSCAGKGSKRLTEVSIDPASLT